MTAAVPGVPVEAVEAAARALYEEERNESMGFDEWPEYDDPRNAGREVFEGHARAALTAALPSLREVIAAEVLNDGPTCSCDQRMMPEPPRWAHWPDCPVQVAKEDGCEAVVAERERIATAIERLREPSMSPDAYLAIQDAASIARHGADD